MKGTRKNIFWIHDSARNWQRKAHRTSVTPRHIKRLRSRNHAADRTGQRELYV